MLDTFTYIAGSTTLSAQVTIETFVRPVLPDGTPIGLISAPTRTLTGTQTVPVNVVLEGARIEGYVKVYGTLRNNEIVGDGVSSSALVQVFNGGLAEDNDIHPQNPNAHVSGGRIENGGTFQRNHIWNVADGIGLISGTAGLVDHNWIHDHVMLSPDPGRANKDMSHDDALQIHGGINWVITYNLFDTYYTADYGDAGEPWVVNPDGTVSGNKNYPKMQALSILMVTALMTDGRYPEGIVFEHNWANGGTVGLNLGGLGSGKVAPWSLGSIAYNTFNGDNWVNGHNKTAILASNSLRVTKLNNFYTDGTPANSRQS